MNPPAAPRRGASPSASSAPPLPRPPGASPSAWSASPPFAPPRRVSPSVSSAPSSSASSAPSSNLFPGELMAGKNPNNDVYPNLNNDDDEYFEPDDEYFEPEDSYLEPEDYYIEDDDDDIVSDLHKLTVRGPGCIGNETYDRHCIFGNVVEMTFEQECQLRVYVEQLPRTPVKSYVSRLINSQIIVGPCEMDFSSQFTQEYLLPLLNPPTSTEMVVQNVEKTIYKYCKMLLKDRKATIASGWNSVVLGLNLKEGDICLFSFMDERNLPSCERDPFVNTRLVLLKLEDERQKITIRGPGITGHESFDRCCIFGNEVEMDFHQVGQLCSWVEEQPRPPIKPYVCRFTESQIKTGDCKMDFTTEFTHFLLPLLKPPTTPDPLSSLVVQIANCEDVRYCRMKLEGGKALITYGWIAVVKGFRLKEGDIYMLSFQDDRGTPRRGRDPFGVNTRLVLQKLEEGKICVNNNNSEDEDEMHKITIRGPGIIGIESFDMECVFGNEVHMTFNQSKELRTLVEVTPRPKIKEYVCKIMKCNVQPECKMDFTAEFTSYYLTEILRSPTNLPLVSLVVNCTESTRNIYCRFKIGELGKATIVGGWRAVVQTFKLEEGDICMFSFTDERVYSRKSRDSLAWLRLVITKLYV